MSTGKKPVLEVATPPQLRLFDGEATESRLSDSSSGGRVFVDPDPRGIYLGARRLDEYLKEAGEQEAFAVRAFLRRQDFSQFEANYAPQGRAPYAPVAMLGLILWGLMHGLDSLRALEKLARTDLSCMWVTGGITPEFSIIGRFIRRHEELLKDGEFFGQLTADIVELCDSDPSRLAGDGTVIEAAASRYRKLNEEAARRAAKKAAEEAEQHPDDEELQKERARAENAEQEVARRAERRRKKGEDPTRAVISPSEPEAYIQRQKHGGTAPSYKPSIMANKDRLITSTAVHPSSEKTVFEELLTKARMVGPVEQILLDGNYFSSGVLTLAFEGEIDILIPDGKLDDGAGKKRSSSNGKFKKTEFVYQPETDTMICPAGQTLKPIQRASTTPATIGYVRYGGADCDGCPFREQCTSAKDGRTVKRYEGDELKEVMREVMSQPKARTTYRQRQAWVEPVFGELRYIQRLQRFRRRGVEKVKVEFNLHAMAHNLRRMLKLLQERRPRVLEQLQRAIIASTWAVYALHSVFSSYQKPYDVRPYKPAMAVVNRSSCPYPATQPSWFG